MFGTVDQRNMELQRIMSDSTGPGTALANMIPDWAVQFKEGCGCRDMQAKMDKWGPDGCLERMDLIVKHLMTQSDNLIPAFKMVPGPMRKVIATGMVRHAIGQVRSS